jgi:NADH:ubiquinone oxidoreductase subunit E/NAD-dependent dihydropyrimidine dehydrogenase PreA subunit
LEVANIREQVSWPHWNDRVAATRKAFVVIRQAIEKVKHDIVLNDIKVPIDRKALVVGGGIAGIQAALDIADGGYKVYLVEKTPSIGGKMLQLSETFPTLDCPQCIATPKMTEVGNHDNIELMSYSEVEELGGFIGNFKVKIKRKPRYIDEVKCTSCKECIINCPVHNAPTIKKPPKYSESIAPDVRDRYAKLIAPYIGNPSALVEALLDINAYYNYLPEEALKYTAEKLDVQLSRVYQVATFYTSLSLKKRGKHIVKVCMGTACHTKGAPNVLEEIERRLGISRGETTADGKYSIETVNCLGCCALGPVVTIDEKYYHAEPADVKSLFDKFEKEEEMKNAH